MYKRTALFLLAILPISLLAQEHLWSIRGGCWNTMGTSSKWNRVLDISSDLEGNTYMLAQSGSSQMQIAELPLTGYAEVNNQTGNNQFNLVLASFNLDGELRWTKVIGGRNDTQGYGIQTDNLGHLYLSGRIYPMQPTTINIPVHFDTDTILPQSYENNEHKKVMFLAQYDTDGTFNWLSMPEPDTVSAVGPWINNSSPYKTDVNPENGDVYWHCILRKGQFAWEGDNVIEEEGDYILQYNSDGEVTGRVKLDMTSGGINTYGTLNLVHMKRDHETGIFYIAGTQVETYEPLIIGGDTIADRLYAAAFSPTGTLLWLTEGNNDEAINGVFANNAFYDMKIEDGYIYLTGTLASGAEFNGHVFDLDEQTSSSPFIMKLDYDGNTQWGQIAATEYNSYCRALAIRGDEVAITGRTGPISWPGANNDATLTDWSTNSHISRFDKVSGDLIALDSISSINGLVDTWEIYASGDCNYYIGGQFNSGLTLGNDDLMHFGAGERSYFYTRYSFGADLAFTYSSSGPEGAYDFNAFSESETISWNFGDGSPLQTGTNISHTFTEEGVYEVCATTSGDCEAEYCVTIYYGTTGLDELSNKVTVYPNPASGEIRIDGLDQSAQYSLFSLSGALVKQGSVSSNSSVDISGISSGMYVMLLQTADGQVGRVKVAVEGE